ncbi:OB-fold domain-containing protein [Bosea sp. (in: a-proteobacteria)]|uniref:Zn-ribbon domain-containing OB-fold protein n=1 Tax=Bosea sp. (in: a-proteobacteria) TaxID=1871050 RepID=UPI001AD0A97B|nr:OB-fold domain-containing protein [Bosea sp. (in: a-proteobacteria)]MBN9437350.1 OB-fold domain-containing protein [Bosea sp. (in: a-proteobacteria)]
MSAEIAYPQPYEDQDNAPFLTGWREGKLLLQQSRGGGPLFFYPRPICPYTGSTDLVWREVSGRGRIISFSLITRPNHPSFNEEVPIVLAEIELDEGASLLGRIIGADAASIASGARIELLPPDEARRYPLPAFRLAA